jgi:hypothetical protein
MSRNQVRSGFWRGFGAFFGIGSAYLVFQLVGRFIVFFIVFPLMLILAAVSTSCNEPAVRIEKSGSYSWGPSTPTPEPARETEPAPLPSENMTRLLGNDAQDIGPMTPERRAQHDHEVMLRNSQQPVPAAPVEPSPPIVQDEIKP